LSFNKIFSGAPKSKQYQKIGNQGKQNLKCEKTNLLGLGVAGLLVAGLLLAGEANAEDAEGVTISSLN
jgi:hypothetical protein